MSLYNPVSYPSNTRRCFWDAEYIASQPFCVTSQLSDKELKILADYEEIKFWERNEQLKLQLSAQALNELDDVLEINRQESVLELAEKELKKFGSSNTQTSGRLLPKITLNRKEFLDR
jgi:hypothetical protein